MIYLLFFLVIGMFVGSYFLFKKEILSPTVVACGVFLVSIFFACLYTNKWNAPISYITVIVVVTALLAFASGEFLARLLLSKHGLKKVSLPSNPINVPNWSIATIVVLSAVFLVIFILYTYSLAQIMGYSSGSSEYSLMSYVRNAQLSNMADISPYNRIATHGLHIITSLSYIFCFIFLYNFVFFKKYGKNWQNLIPVVISLPFVMFSGGRVGLIFLTEIVFIIAVLFFMQKMNWGSDGLKRVVKWIWVGGISFYMLFIIAGSFKSHAFSQRPFDSIAFYTGLSIASLDNYLKNPRPENEFFGEETLSGLYGILKKAGLDIPEQYTQYTHLEFSNFAGASGNVYTAVRRLLQDYGWVGMYCFMFFFGLFYSAFFLFIKNKQNCAVIVYAYMFYAVIMMPIDEQFFTTVFSLPFFERIFFVIILYELFVRRRFTKFVEKKLYDFYYCLFG
jgi:oligosaccharide repeat unit polymerase